MKNIILFLVKIIGLVWVFPCIPFRAYARSIVYNYILQNQKKHLLGRLWERDPVLTVKDGCTGYILHDVVHDVGREGFVKCRKVNALKFYLVVIFIWMWLDDDANHDTTDLGYISSWFIGERRNRTFAKVVNWLTGNIVPGEHLFGNSFDLGDYRDIKPFFNFWCTFFWNVRNTGMNYQYLWMGY